MVLNAEEYSIVHNNILKLTPDIKGLIDMEEIKGLVKEKGRKKNFYLRDLRTNSMNKIERLLDTSEYKSFLEISLRASQCPLPLNLDTWDGLKCPYACAYCYADYFKASLYTSFFDNPKSIGLRSINPDVAIQRLQNALDGKQSNMSPDVKKGLKYRIPLRFGIRFEDFHKKEAREGVSLKIMEYLHDIDYPYMINTKSNILSEERYIRCFGDNTAIHITLLGLDPDLAKNIESGAPSVSERLESMKDLTSVTRVVVRIEPYMVGINSEPDDLREYARVLKELGVEYATWDTYSYSANNVNIAQRFEKKGYNWERMFDITSNWQPLGSLLLDGAMNIFRDEGLKCATFDFGNVPANDFDVCCCTDGIRGFENYNRYNILSAGRFIIKRGCLPTSLETFKKWAGDPINSEIESNFLSFWNLEGKAWDLDYIPGISLIGVDSDGNNIYKYDRKNDYRIQIKEVLLNV